MNFAKPWQHTGIDFTGQISVKVEGEIVKMYILIFTCLNVRAVHFELLPNMSTKQVLLAYVRHFNRFQPPQKIYSDNANSFLSSLKILNRSSLDNEYKDFLLKYNVQHVTIPLYGAWQGAAWERLLRCVKGCIRKTIGRKILNYFEYLTLLTDVENSVNMRPLTYRNIDQSDFDIITPNSFLKLSTGEHLVFGEVGGDQFQPPAREELLGVLERRQAHLDTFLDLWRTEYLLALRETGRDLYQETWKDRITVGEVVLIQDKDQPRSHWKVGLVTQLILGHDNKVRSAKVRRPDRSEGIYPICHLVPLELSVTSAPENPPSDEVPPRDRPTPRRAALECKRKLRSLE